MTPEGAALGVAGIQFGSNLIGTWAARKTAKEMMSMEEKNFQQQEAVFDWQQALQRNIFEREDNAIQRRVKDLKAAGLSPVLAAGQGARAGSPIAVKAPQRGIEGAKAKMDAQLEFSARNAMIGRTAAETALMAKQAEEIDSRININTEKVKELINTNEFLTRTLEPRVDQQFSEANIQIFKTRTAEYEASMDHVDQQLKTAFMDWIIQDTKRTGGKDGQIAMDINPYYVEFMAAKALSELKQQDRDFYQKLRAGGAGVQTGMRLLESILRFIK